MNNNPTPCGALFDVMKKHASISYKELAGLILSNRPLSDGRSPISRVGDRTWISRFIVHAPAGSLQERYFCDYGVAALRVMARLRSRANRPMRGSDVLVMLRDQGIPEMTAALSRIGEDASVLRNVFDRLVCGSGYSEDERPMWPWCCSSRPVAWEALARRPRLRLSMRKPRTGVGSRPRPPL